MRVCIGKLNHFMKYLEEVNVFKATRENTLAAIKGLTLAQINESPKGFTGNIAWHLGHMVSTHRGLVYQLNSVPSGLEKEFILKYKKDSKPEAPISQEEFEYITEQLMNQIDELRQDLQKENFFGENIPYKTSYNYTMNSFDSCIMFNNLHQALHLGYIMALKRSL